MISVVPQNSLKINEKYQHFDADKAFEGLLPFRGTQGCNDKPPREPKGCRCGDVLCGIATPLYLSLSLIIQEGFPLNELDLIIRSTKASTEEAEVIIIDGDTKVVNQRQADKLFINTLGIGIIPDGVNISGANAKPGDKVILSDTIGGHGIPILSRRVGLKFYVANEGKLVAIIKPDDSDKIFGSNEEKFLWQKCSIIGEVTNDYAGKVIMKPKLGSLRIIDMLSEELLPRIC